MPRENKTMITLVMQHLKMLVVEEVVLVILISQDLFRIFSKTSLVILEVTEDGVKNLILEDLIYDMIYQ